MAICSTLSSAPVPRARWASSPRGGRSPGPLVRQTGACCSPRAFEPETLRRARCTLQTCPGQLNHIVPWAQKMHPNLRDIKNV